jgi:hypothetical protein
MTCSDDCKINLECLIDKRAHICATDGITQAIIMSVGDLVRIVECCHTGSYQYRGQRKESWELLPSLTRTGGPVNALGPNETLLEKERHILKEFRTVSAQYLPNLGLAVRNEIPLAALAQHHGAPTRLLDWTMNPLAALYFAVEEEEEEDHGNSKGEDNKNSVVWAIRGHRERIYSCQRKRFPSPGSGVQFIIPEYAFNRAAVQRSIFALWGDPEKSMDKVVTDKSALWKIIIPKGQRANIKWALYTLGISKDTLFPDLDGVGNYLSWKHSGIHEKNFSESGIPLGRESR